MFCQQGSTLWITGILSAKAYSKSCEASKIECFAKIVNGFKPLTIFAKRSILKVRKCSEHAIAIGRHLFKGSNKEATAMSINCFLGDL